MRGKGLIITFTIVTVSINIITIIMIIIIKVYDEKSDIWALGCILYEMACLQKTFEGSNLPALVNKIMKGQFAPIRGNYSPLFKQLVRSTNFGVLNSPSIILKYSL